MTANVWQHEQAYQKSIGNTVGPLFSLMIKLKITYGQVLGLAKNSKNSNWEVVNTRMKICILNLIKNESIKEKFHFMVHISGLIIKLNRMHLGLKILKGVKLFG